MNKAEWGIYEYAEVRSINSGDQERGSNVQQKSSDILT